MIGFSKATRDTTDQGIGKQPSAGTRGGFVPLANTCFCPAASFSPVVTVTSATERRVRSVCQCWSPGVPGVPQWVHGLFLPFQVPVPNRPNFTRGPETRLPAILGKGRCLHASALRPHRHRLRTQSSASGSQALEEHSRRWRRRRHPWLLSTTYHGLGQSVGLSWPSGWRT